MAFKVISRSGKLHIRPTNIRQNVHILDNNGLNQLILHCISRIDEGCLWLAKRRSNVRRSKVIFWSKGQFCRQFWEVVITRPKLILFGLFFARADCAAFLKAHNYSKHIPRLFQGQEIKIENWL